MQRCRVTFYDTTHEMNRTLEVDAATPADAVRRALTWLHAYGITAEDLGPIATVEVITTVRHTLPVATAQALSNAA